MTTKRYDVEVTHVLLLAAEDGASPEARLCFTATTKWGKRRYLALARLLNPVKLKHQAAAWELTELPLKSAKELSHYLLPGLLLENMPSRRAVEFHRAAAVEAYQGAVETAECLAYDREPPTYSWAQRAAM